MVDLIVFRISRTEVLGNLSFTLLIALDEAAESQVRLTEVADLREACLDATVGLTALLFGSVNHIHDVGVILLPSATFASYRSLHIISVRFHGIDRLKDSAELVS